MNLKGHFFTLALKIFSILFIVTCCHSAPPVTFKAFQASYQKKSWVLVHATIEKGYHLYGPHEAGTVHITNKKNKIKPDLYSTFLMLSMGNEKFEGYEGEMWIAFKKESVDALGKDLILEFVVCSEKGCIPASIPLKINVPSKEERPVLLNVLASLTQDGKTQTSILFVLSTLLFAFLGGLILNVMPCVLPVLSLKVLSLSTHSEDSSKKTSLYKGLGYTIGTLTTFWGLALTIIILKSCGKELGWGFQLQSCQFVGGLMGLFLLISLNLFGIFDVGVFLGRMSLSLPKARVFTSNFLSGVLTTLMATPCTAPFMGTALAMSLTQSHGIVFCIFSALGLGMACPYLLMLYVPMLRKWIPRPGKWMVSFKHFLGFGMLGTVIWLSHILITQVGVDEFIQTLWGLFFIAFGAWILGHWGSLMSPTRSRYFVRAISGSIMVSGLMSTQGTVFFTPQRDFLERAIPYDPLKFNDVFSKKSHVMLVFSAKWCLTCHVQHALLFQNDEVRKVLSQSHIEMIKVDMTTRDEKSSELLRQYGRHSIPFYVLFKNGRTVFANESLSIEQLCSWGNS